MVILFLIAFVLCLLYAVWVTLGIRESHDEWHMNLSFIKGFPFYALSLVFLALTLSFVQVGSGSVGVVTRWGRATRQIQPGAHLVVPIAEDVYSIPIQTRIVKPNENAASHDLQLDLLKAGGK